MPAAAVIPASLAYPNVAAVKKLVVETLRGQVRNVPGVRVDGVSVRRRGCFGARAALPSAIGRAQRTSPFGPSNLKPQSISGGIALHRVAPLIDDFTLIKLECSKQVG